MQKPLKIFLIRHGQSLGNVDNTVYEHTPDWKIPLTEIGQSQAILAGKKLSEKLVSPNWILDPDISSQIKADVLVYSSPWVRSRETAKPFMDYLENKHPWYSSNCVYSYRYYEDPRLREQDWGNFQEPAAMLALKRERKKFGSFFYRFPNGESGADVYDRISTFLETLFRDLHSKKPTNIAIFTHGFTMRVFLMRWFHWSVEEFELLKNPSNCHMITLSLVDDKYHVEGITKRPNSSS